MLLHLQMRAKKCTKTQQRCLRTSHCLLRRMFSVECSQARLCEQTKLIFPFFCNNHKTLFYFEVNFKRRPIVVDVRFENWGLYHLLSNTPVLAAFHPLAPRSSSLVTSHCNYNRLPCKQFMRRETLIS